MGSVPNRERALGRPPEKALGALVLEYDLRAPQTVERENRLGVYPSPAHFPPPALATVFARATHMGVVHKGPCRRPAFPDGGVAQPATQQL